MTERLIFIRETALARLYQFADKTLLWVPKSVCKSVTKFKVNELEAMVDKPVQEVHEVTIEDWWWEKNVEKDEDHWEQDEL